MKTRKKSKYIHANRYVAQVEVELIEDAHEWAPYLNVEDAKKLDYVRKALENEDLKKASQYGQIYEMKPVF